MSLDSANLSQNSEFFDVTSKIGELALLLSDGAFKLSHEPESFPLPQPDLGWFCNRDELRFPDWSHPYYGVGPKSHEFPECSPAQFVQSPIGPHKSGPSEFGETNSNLLYPHGVGHQLLPQLPSRQAAERSLVPADSVPPTAVSTLLWLNPIHMEQAMRVQALAQAGISEVPVQYIQPPEDRPECVSIDSTSSLKIPEIDLSSPGDSLLASIKGACREWGAFHVTNHGVPADLLDQMREVTRSFFTQLPLEQKLGYACDPGSAASEGYGSRMLLDGEEGDGALDWRDYMDHHTLPPSRRNPARWPDFPPQYRQVVAGYADEMSTLAKRLLSLVSESLGAGPSCIQEAVGEVFQNITASYYPPCPRPDLTLGLQSHSDMGAVTLLVQDGVAGLQVLKDKDWVTVHCLPQAIVVLLADQTEIISNGKYHSAIHRAITNSSKARLSIATFHDPAKDKVISPSPQIVSHDETVPCYRPTLYGEYVSSWYTKGPKGKRNLDALLVSPYS